MDQNELKKRVAREAAQVVFENTNQPIVLGVGTGSTVDFFIHELIKHRSKIRSAVSSSERSARLLRQLDIEVVEATEVSGIAIYVDGADEVDPSFALIKGGGGAHTREKIVASIASDFLCIVDETKCVSRLGKFPIPMEVVQMAQKSVSEEITTMGGRAVLREGFITDNGHILLDIHRLIVEDPDQLEMTLNNIAGVIDTGIFARNRPSRVIVGGTEGVYDLKRMTTVMHH